MDLPQPRALAPRVVSQEPAERSRCSSGLRAQAEEPESVDALLHVIEARPRLRGVPVGRRGEVPAVGVDEDAVRVLRPAGQDHRAPLTASDFEDWIREDVRAIAACVDGLLGPLQRSAPGDVESVFLTGGSSLVPMVRRYFARRFGATASAGARS